MCAIYILYSNNFLPPNTKVTKNFLLNLTDVGKDFSPACQYTNLDGPVNGLDSNPKMTCLVSPSKIMHQYCKLF